MRGMQFLRRLCFFTEGERFLRLVVCKQIRRRLFVGMPQRSALHPLDSRRPRLVRFLGILLRNGLLLEEFLLRIVIQQVVLFARALVAERYNRDRHNHKGQHAADADHQHNKARVPEQLIDRTPGKCEVVVHRDQCERAVQQRRDPEGRKNGSNRFHTVLLISQSMIESHGAAGCCFSRPPSSASSGPVPSPHTNRMR